jgi:catechol 2,3-dioxygenase-like lactoylglutathione lyase family enzyme
MERTLEFYEGVLGFPAVVCEMVQPEAGGAIRHAFFDVGQGELLAFMEANDVPGVSPDFDAGINRGLGVSGGMYHFAFRVADPAELADKQAELESKGVKVRGIVDHGWCQSIYFHDPNFVQLEFCCLTEALGEEHRSGRLEGSWRRLARR